MGCEVLVVNMHPGQRGWGTAMQNRPNNNLAFPVADGTPSAWLEVTGALISALAADSPKTFPEELAQVCASLTGLPEVRVFARQAAHKDYLICHAERPAVTAPLPDLPIVELAVIPPPGGPHPAWSGVHPGLVEALRHRQIIPAHWRSCWLAVWWDAGLRPLALAVIGGRQERCAAEVESLIRSLAVLAAPAWHAWQRWQDLQKRQEQLQERLAQVTAACGLANAELLRAARLSDQFLANMSHELRTPLNTVLGMAQALQEGVMGPVNDDQMSYLQMIEKAGRQLLAMMTDILTLAKAGAGRLEVHPEMVALQALCDDCLHFIIQPARQKHMRLDLRCDARIPVLEADENILKQILVNLLTNAVKFTPERGTLTLEVAAEPENHAVAFHVSDTGIGISPEQMDRLFQPFVQLHDGLARQFSGTGLGLSLVYRLTDLHGGSVSVTSAPGQGSTFTVRLPWSPPSPPPAELPSLAEARLLLVDDNERNLAAARKILESAGANVTVARQSAEALERAAEERPEVMILDLQLTGMNGWALMKHIQTNPQLRGLKLVALSSMLLPGQREQCLAAGAVAHLPLPLCAPHLLQAVATALQPAGNSSAQLAVSSS